MQIAVSRFWTEYHHWQRQEVQPFFTVSGALIKPLFENVDKPISLLVDVLEKTGVDVDTKRRAFADAQRKATNALAAFPTEDPDVSVPRQSALEAYKQLRALFATATSRVEVFDPFLGAPTFLLYLVEVRDDVQITVVSDEGRLRPDLTKKKDIAHRDRLVALSELFAFDRPSSYRLLMAPRFHDRHIRVDDKIFHVGGSLAHAAMHDDFAITRTDSNPGLHAARDNDIQISFPWYQPGMAKHRRWCRVCGDIKDVKPNDNCDICNSPTTV